MKIHLALGLSDKRYLKRFTDYLEQNHLDRLELYTFSENNAFRAFVQESLSDVIIVDEAFAIPSGELPSGRQEIILSEDDEAVREESGAGVRRVSKYQKPELLFMHILDAFSECGFSAGNRSSKNTSESFENGNKILMVTSFSGGTGASAVAVGLAKRLAVEEKKVFYLSFSPETVTDLYFTNKSELSFEDIIFAVKSGNINLDLKLEAASGKDSSGVSFIRSTRKAIDMLDLTMEEKKRIVISIVSSGRYDYVILDEKFSLSEDFISLASLAGKIIVVGNGEESSNAKFERNMESLRIMENQTGARITSRMSLLYNHFSSSCSSEEISEPGIAVIGKIPPVTHARMKNIIDYIQKYDGLERI